MRITALLLAFALGLLLPDLSEAATRGTLGSKKCTWGPAYWCKGIPQSKECSATSHCIEKVWKNQVLPEDNDDVCTICKNMVQEARDTLRSNETIDEMKQVFEGSCDLIPLKIIADECKVLSDQFVAELVETLSSEMNPQVVCATAGLCNSARIDKLLHAYYQSKPRQTECDVCNAESEKLANKIRAIPADDLLDKMFELCGQMSSYSDSCRATVMDNFDLIYDMMSNLGDGQLCQLVGICSETTKNQPAVYRTNDVQCEFCEKVLQHWVDTWTANTTQAEFKQVLEAICHKLDKPERVSHCLHIVDDYYIPWFDYLLHTIKPHQICALVGLCGGGEFMKVDNQAPITLLLDSKRRGGANDDETVRMTPLKPQIRMTGNEEHQQLPALTPSDVSQGLIGGYFAPQTALTVNKPGCVICEFALHDLQKWLSDRRHEQWVEDGVKRLCHRLPAKVRDQCDNLVDSYGPAIVQLFVHGLDASEICARLTLCPAPASGIGLLEQQASYPTSVQLLKRGEDSCALCEYGLQTVFSMLNDTTNQQEIANVLDSMCYKLPVSVRNECEKLVAEYTSTIIDLIMKMYTPDQICAKLKLCSGTPKQEEEETQLVLTTKDQECVLCEYVITTLIKMIGDKHNEEQVKAALDKLCGYLPKTVSAQCVNFVDTYSDMIIDLIVHDLPPEQICAQLGLCVLELNQILNEIRHPVHVGDDRPYCTLCEYAIGEVDKMIADKKNEEEIKSVLDRICYELSAPIKKECLTMVDQYTDEIIQMFISEYTPEQICAELGLCKPTPPKKGGSNFVYHLTDSNELPPLEAAEAALRPSVVAAAVNGGPFCVLCEFGMSIIEKQILNNRTFDMVERAVQMMCSYMPQSVAEPCEEFVDKYGDEIIHIIVQEEMDPKTACTLMALCTEVTKTFDATPLGGHRCAWGPSYWCQSRFHAKTCGTTEHCERNVWH